MKVGDKVRRKTKHSDYPWSNGDKICEVIAVRGKSSIKLSVNGVCISWWDTNLFDLVENPQPDYLQQLKDAQDIIGKRMMYGKSASTAIIQSVSIYHKNHKEKLSIQVLEYLKTHDYCVVAFWNDRDNSYPFEELKHTPKFKTMKIGDYDAKVYTDKIEVGCQTIPLSTMEEAVKLAKSI